MGSTVKHDRYIAAMKNTNSSHRASAVVISRWFVNDRFVLDRV
jgi:hypothetical protein